MRFRNFSCAVSLVVLLAAGLLGARPAVAGAVHVLSSDSDVIGSVSTIVARFEDTFLDLGRAHNVGFEELRKANPSVNAWVPGEGTEVLLPTRFVLPDAAREGVVINIAEYRIYFFYRVDDELFVATLPASVGRMDWETPLGRTRIVSRVQKPSWYPPQSVREEYAADGRSLPSVVPPGPDNPLGDYALRLGLPGYLIHGTNRPDGVGMRVTHGCIRLFPEDIEWLFPRTSVDMPVQIVNQPVKFGWDGDALFLEVHPELEGTEAEGSSMTAVTEAYVRATRERAADVDWELIAAAYRERTGVPLQVGRAIQPATEDSGAKKTAALERTAASLLAEQPL